MKPVTLRTAPQDARFPTANQVGGPWAAGTQQAAGQQRCEHCTAWSRRRGRLDGGWSCRVRAHARPAHAACSCRHRRGCARALPAAQQPPCLPPCLPAVRSPRSRAAATWRTTRCGGVVRKHEGVAQGVGGRVERRTGGGGPSARPRGVQRGGLGWAGLMVMAAGLEAAAACPQRACSSRDLFQATITLPGLPHSAALQVHRRAGRGHSELPPTTAWFPGPRRPSAVLQMHHREGQGQRRLPPLHARLPQVSAGRARRAGGGGGQRGCAAGGRRAPGVCTASGAATTAARWCGSPAERRGSGRAGGGGDWAVRPSSACRGGAAPPAHLPLEPPPLSLLPATRHPARAPSICPDEWIERWEDLRESGARRLPACVARSGRGGCVDGRRRWEGLREGGGWPAQHGTRRAC